MHVFFLLLLSLWQMPTTIFSKQKNGLYVLSIRLKNGVVGQNKKKMIKESGWGWYVHPFYLQEGKSINFH
jgi:hypothetical protein